MLLILLHHRSILSASSLTGASCRPSHVDTVQTVLDDITISSCICWSHTTKVLGSLLTFVKRNSATIVILRHICFAMLATSLMFAVNVQSVSIEHVILDCISWNIQILGSFAMVRVVNILNIRDTLRLTLEDVLKNCDIWTWEVTVKETSDDFWTWHRPIARDQPNSREKMHDFTAEFLKCVKFHGKFTERVSEIHEPHRRYFEVLC